MVHYDSHVAEKNYSKCRVRKPAIRHAENHSGERKKEEKKQSVQFSRKTVVERIFHLSTHIDMF